MSPQSGGGAELALGPEQLRELRVRHFQTQMDNAHTTIMLDADNPETERASIDLSDFSVATAATAVRAVELSATNKEFDE
eukprot:4849010-Pyramimonas_sp.AAC.1